LLADTNRSVKIVSIISNVIDAQVGTPAMPPNVLLVILDTVRAKNTSVHGYHNPTTPFLEDFSEKATLYEQARAPAARSLDSHTSIFTGLHVEEHQVTRTGDKLSPGNTVWESLTETGYATGVFSENNWLTDIDSGLKDAFDHIEGPRNVPFPGAADPTTFVAEEGQGEYHKFLRHAIDSGKPIRSLLNGASIKLQSDYPAILPRGSTGTHGSTYTDLFLEWSANQAQPWAACVNYMDAHHPYEPDDEYDRWGGDHLRRLQDDIEDVKWEFNGGQRPWWQRRALEGLYDGCIRQLDAELERLIDALRERNELDDTLVVITSDHGEGFSDPSRIRPGTRVASHSVAIHECLLHVPLVVKYPEQTGGTVIDTPVSLTDFPRAVESTLDGDGDPRAFVTDRPVVATAHGLDDPVQERASNYVDDLTPFTATARAVYEADEGTVEKYVTWRDRGQTVSVRDAHTAWTECDDDGGVVSETFSTIDDAGVKESGDSPTELDEQSVRQLEDLGYM
jgi:arylsulfatase